MLASKKDQQILRRFLVAAAMLLGVIGLNFTASSPMASALSNVPTCADSQLAVAVVSSSGAYFAAGNVGIPFVIINISKTTCSLKGYPRLTTYPAAYKFNRVRVTDGGGMIFVQVRPKVVTIGAGATASFGLNYGDAYDQQDPNSGPCMTKKMQVFLPTRSHPFAQSYSATVDVNFCYAGFKFEITSIQSGPIARLG